jgi:GrpB-like predicted nucleotidyltransferase (UPF0157 family)
MMRKVEVVPHNPNWNRAFQDESTQVIVALGDNVIAIDHIGSTAIATISAKPIIDILVSVADIAKVDDRNASMHALGYEVMGEYGIAGRRYFRKDNESGIRTHHVHVFTVGSAQINRHLAFRDYMRVHPEEAQRYSDLKQTLAKQYPDDIEGYMDGKDKFIKAIDQKAAVWQTKLSSNR